MECILPAMQVSHAVVERVEQVGSASFRPGGHAFGQPAASSPLFQHDERRWMAQAFPHLQKLPSQARSKQIEHIGAGEIVALPAHCVRAGHIVAVAGFVERHAHVIGEGERPLAPDALNDKLLKWSHHHNAPKLTTSRSSAISGVMRLRLRAASVASNWRYAPSSSATRNFPIWRMAFSATKGAMPVVEAICWARSPSSANSLTSSSERTCEVMVLSRRSGGSPSASRSCNRSSACLRLRCARASVRSKTRASCTCAESLRTSSASILPRSPTYIASLST